VKRGERKGNAQRRAFGNLLSDLLSNGQTVHRATVQPDGTICLELAIELEESSSIEKELEDLEQRFGQS